VTHCSLFDSELFAWIIRVSVKRPLNSSVISGHVSWSVNQQVLVVVWAGCTPSLGRWRHSRWLRQQVGHTAVTWTADDADYIAVCRRQCLARWTLRSRRSRCNPTTVCDLPGNTASLDLSSSSDATLTAYNNPLTPTVAIRVSYKAWTSECPEVKNYKRLFNPVWHRILTHMATMDVIGLTFIWPNVPEVEHDFWAPRRHWNRLENAHVYMLQAIRFKFAAAAPPPFRPSDPALCGSCPLVTLYYCRLEPCADVSISAAARRVILTGGGGAPIDFFRRRRRQ